MYAAVAFSVMVVGLCTHCALQYTTFLQPLTEKPQSTRGAYFGGSTGPRLVKMKKVVCLFISTHSLSMSLLHISDRVGMC